MGRLKNFFTNWEKIGSQHSFYCSGIQNNFPNSTGPKEGTTSSKVESSTNKTGETENQGYVSRRCNRDTATFSFPKSRSCFKSEEVDFTTITTDVIFKRDRRFCKNGTFTPSRETS